MEYKLIIDKTREEFIHISVHEKTELIEKIERLMEKQSNIILGYKDEEIYRINILETECFFTDKNKIYIYFSNERFLIKERLYQIEKLLDESFIKINKGCIVNIGQIEKFQTSIGGAIKVVLKNGFEDYISRRNVKEVKERLGL